MTWIDRITDFKAVVWLATMLAVLLGSMTTMLAAGIWSVYGAGLVSVARFELGIEEIANELRIVSGENRPFRQPRGLSWVVAPVRQGAKVQIILTLARTKLGAPCDFIGGRAIFEDTTGIPNTGGKIEVLRQISTETARLRVFVDQPVSAVLLSGRVLVYLALDYRCGQARITEATDPMWFDLLPAENPTP